MSARDIAIVDDEEELREAMQLLLEHKGYETRSWGRPDVALEALTKAPPALLLTDLRMEPIDGIELVRGVKAAHPDVPAIVMTGFPSLDTAVAALRLGVDDYLEKPTRGRDLMDRIETLLTGETRSTRSHETLRDAVALPIDENTILESARFCAAHLSALGLAGSYQRRFTRAILEAVHNVQRHAYDSSPEETPRVELKVETSPQEVSFIVIDRGIGFDPASPDGALTGKADGGLLRAYELVPTMRIESTPGRGTRIVFPVERERLSEARRFARWTITENRGPCPIEEAPWWPPGLPDDDRVHATQDEATADQTARNVLWL